MSSPEQWNHYWRLGHTQSCFSGGKPLDCGPVWRPFFESLPPGARVLDLACGAGALAHYASEANRGFDFVGVDFATDIRPVEGMRTVTGASIEALPFEGGAFDAIVSQFGFEYADTARAAGEARRVMAPGARLRLLMHAAEGGAVRDLAGRLERGEKLLEPHGYMRKLRAAAAAAVGGTPMAPVDADIDAARAAALAGAQDNTTRRVLDVLGEAYTMRRMFGPAYLLEKADGLIDELAQYCARIADMQAAARTQTDVEAICMQFRGSGLDMQAAEPFREAGGELVGWVVDGRLHA